MKRRQLIFGLNISLILLLLTALTDITVGCTDETGLVLSNNTCETLIGNFSTYCYTHIAGDFITRCCDSCSKKAKESCDPACLYGDKRLDCAGADCSVFINQIFCCATCPSANAVTCTTTTTSTSTTTTPPTTTTPQTTTPPPTTETTPTITTRSTTTAPPPTKTASSPTTTTPTATTSPTATTNNAETSRSSVRLASTAGRSDAISASSAGTFSDTVSIGMYSIIAGAGAAGLALCTLGVIYYMKRSKRTNSRVDARLTNNWME